MTDCEKEGGKSRRRIGAPKNWRKTFLAALAETSNIAVSAERADISVSCVNRTRRENPAFARQWLAAVCEAYDNLEMEVLERLRNGEDKDASGTKYDNAGAIRMLSMHRAEMARARALRDNCDEEAVLESIDAMIDAMRERAAATAALIDDGGRDGDDPR